MAGARVMKELAVLDGKDYALSGVRATPIGGDSTHLLGVIKGPPDSPYEGGEFEIDIQLPQGYPFHPPKMRFNTKLWHPNVSSQTGAICLDILKDQWTPGITIKTALLSLQALLTSPVPDDPQDAEVAGQYKKDRKAWEATAKYWTDSYAKKKAPEPAASVVAGGAGAAAPLPVMTPAEREKVDQLKAMGFEEGASLRALRVNTGNLEQAIEYLFRTT